jgi:DNA invertase Pin-like site-specific DNA recombinase
VTGTVIEGWPKRGRNEHFTEAEIGQIRSAYRNGVSVIDIARGLRCSRRNVYKHLEHVTAGDRALRKALRPKIEAKQPPAPRPVLPSRHYKGSFEL